MDLLPDTLQQVRAAVNFLMAFVTELVERICRYNNLFFRVSEQIVLDFVS